MKENNKSISDKIAEIVAARENAGEEFYPMKKNIDKWRILVDKIDLFSNKEDWCTILGEAKSCSDWEMINRDAINLKELIDSLSGWNGCLTKACNRASRKWLNIGSIGRWRQGKSELISKLTGLDKWIIPRNGATDACTGTTINIINNAYIENGKEKIDIALIYHYTVKEICELINTYFEKLGISECKVTAATKTELKNYCRKCISDIKNKVVSGELTRLKRTLELYIDKVDDYVDVLIEGNEGDSSKIENLRESDASKREYYSSVSFYETPESREDRRTYKVLATKKAEVYISFEILGQSVGEIQILDTPGIGEARIGVNGALQDALRNDLDIAIALRESKANSPISLEDENFHQIICTELRERKSKSDWLFYLFNYYDGTNLGISKQIQESVKASLSTKFNGNKDHETEFEENAYSTKTSSKKTEEIEGIVLPDNHMATIDCFNDKIIELNKDGSIIKKENGVHTFFIQILESMISSIKDIDDDFYREARAKYKTTEGVYKKLLSAVNELRLPSYVPSDIVPDVIQAISKELSSLKDIDIVKDIKDEIEEFSAEEWEGIQLKKLFLGENIEIYKDDISKKRKKAKTEIEADDKEEIDKSIAFDLEEELGDKLVGSQTYAGFREFESYASLKSKFSEEFKKDIIHHIKDDNAQRKIEEIKKYIWNIFRTTGKLNYLSKDEGEEDWYRYFIDKLEAENKYSSLLYEFENLHKFTVNIEQETKSFINSIDICFHCDDFGGIGFRQLKNARQAFIYSLYMIEMKVKKHLRERHNLITQIINGCNQNFLTCLKNFAQIARVNNEDEKLNICWKELNNFYTINFDEIFANEDCVKKKKIIDEWKRLTPKTNEYE